MKKIYFATGNSGKADEAQKILGLEVKIADLELDEIQELDLKKIVRHKLTQAYEKLKFPVIVDDVSLELDAWDGFPGPFVKFMHKNDTGHFLHIIRNETNRNATLIATIGYHDGAGAHFFTGKLRVMIAKKSLGENGWGLDPILIPEGKKLTFAQMPDGEKNSDSHRARALKMFKKFLDSKKA